MGRNFFLAALVLSCGAMLGQPAAADTKAGVDAWTRGEFGIAVKEWQTQAARGDGDAVFNLGQAYRLGKGVKQDLTKAEQLFGQAAGMGHLQAADIYGLLLFQRGERTKALPYLRAAAERGDPRAQYLLGIAHFNGDLMPKDWPRAYALVTLAQQQGLPLAAGALVQMDQYIPLDQRRQGVQLAAELGSKADATRARQLAAVDLGSQVSSGITVPVPGPSQPLKVPTIASASDGMSQAQRVAGRESPATAGADYARPAVKAVVPPVVTPSPRPVIKPAPTLTAISAPPAPATIGGSWRVQLGAFGVTSNANALWAKLRIRPELAGHARLNTKAGAVTKLQAGGYSQGAAQAACAKLKAAGIACTAVPR